MVYGTEERLSGGSDREISVALDDRPACRRARMSWARSEWLGWQPWELQRCSKATVKELLHITESPSEKPRFKDVLR